MADMNSNSKHSQAHVKQKCSNEQLTRDTRDVKKPEKICNSFIFEDKTKINCNTTHCPVVQCLNRERNITIDEMEAYYEPLLRDKDNIISVLNIHIKNMKICYVCGKNYIDENDIYNCPYCKISELKKQVDHKDSEIIDLKSTITTLQSRLKEK